LTFEFDSANVKELWKQIGEVQEVFGETHCGACKSENIRFRCRTVEENDYYELHCTDCNKVKAYGQLKKGNKLFPKRKDKEGNWLKDNGWVSWGNLRDDASDSGESAPAEAPAAEPEKPAAKSKTKKDGNVPF
jgi:hypothetical protein